MTCERCPECGGPVDFTSTDSDYKTCLDCYLSPFDEGIPDSWDLLAVRLFTVMMVLGFLYWIIPTGE